MTPHRAPEAASSSDPQAKPGHRSRVRAAANRDSILEAARDLISSHGAAALTLDAVAQRADVSVQTIYNRVGGRSALLVAVAERAMEGNRAYMDVAYATPGGPEERIRRAAATYVRFSRERPDEFRLLVEPPAEPAAMAGIAALNAEQNGKLEVALREAIAGGDGRSDLDPADLATMIWANLNGILALAWRPGELRKDHEAIDRLVDLYITSMSEGLLPR